MRNFLLILFLGLFFISCEDTKEIEGVKNEKFIFYIKNTNSIDQIYCKIRETQEIKQLTFSTSDNSNLSLNNNIIKYIRDDIEYYQVIDFFIENIVNPHNKIVCWGNSITAVGQGEGLSYPDILARLSGLEVVNGGVGGQDSRQITVRQGGIPLIMSVSNNVIPANGSVAVTEKNINILYDSGFYRGEATGFLGGVHGKLTTDSNKNWRFTRDIEGEVVSCPEKSTFIMDTFGTENYMAIFWLGHNNFKQGDVIMSNLEAAINHLKSLDKKFLVLSLIVSSDRPKGSADYIQIMKLNAQFKEKYQDNYLDVRQVLQDSYNPSIPQDVEDYNNDVLPYSLRMDHIHPNYTGTDIIAKAVYEKIKELNWIEK